MYISALNPTEQAGGNWGSNLKYKIFKKYQGKQRNKTDSQKQKVEVISWTADPSTFRLRLINSDFG